MVVLIVQIYQFINIVNELTLRMTLIYKWIIYHPRLSNSFCDIFNTCILWIFFLTDVFQQLSNLVCQWRNNFVSFCLEIKRCLDSSGFKICRMKYVELFLQFLNNDYIMYLFTNFYKNKNLQPFKTILKCFLRILFVADILYISLHSLLK